MLKSYYHGRFGSQPPKPPLVPIRVRPGCALWAAGIWLSAVMVGGVGCNQGNTPGIKRDEVRQSNLLRNAARPDILVVGGETMTYADVVNMPLEQNAQQDAALVPLIDRLRPLAKAADLGQFKKLAGPIIEQQLRNQISTILLYQEARRYIDKDIDEPLEKAVDKEYRRLLIRYGGDEAKAEETLKKAGMTREVFRQRQKRAFVIQYYVGMRLPENRPITYSELTQAYDAVKGELFVRPAVLTFRLIDIDTQKVTAPGPSTDRLTRARELAGQLLKRIQAGEDFAELAKQHSNEPRAELGGLWKPKNPKALASPYDALAAQADKMEPGQIAGPIEVEGHIFIMKLEEKTPESYEPLESVQDRVKEKIVTDRRMRALEELSNKVMEQVAAVPMDDFVNFCLEQAYAACKQ